MCNFIKTFFQNLESGNIVDIFAIIFNLILAVWVINNLQNKQSNQRALKDYYIEEIRRVKEMYIDFFKNCHRSDELTCVSLKKDIKYLSSHFQYLINDLNDNLINDSEKKIDITSIEEFLSNLEQSITDSQEFVNSFDSGAEFSFNEITSVNNISKHERELVGTIGVLLRNTNFY
ncbi:hypothetical protein [Myroides odoratus]|uniref:hypothetical protein n=1 Tax=Myroides odoratus TaxID=256 RepID=UPI000765BD23|nr:hypothetical protein [Myroides odoratus]